MSAHFLDCCFQYGEGIARGGIPFEAYEMRMRCNRFRVFLLHRSEVLENKEKRLCDAFTKIRCLQNVLYVTNFLDIPKANRCFLVLHIGSYDLKRTKFNEPPISN